MPRKVMTSISVPLRRPERCIDCPLLGKRPAEEVPHGCKMNRVCLMTGHLLSGHGALTGNYRRCTDADWAEMEGRFTISIPFARVYKIRIPGDEQLTLNL